MLQRYKVMFVDVDKGQDPKTVSPSDCVSAGNVCMQTAVGKQPKRCKAGVIRTRVAVGLLRWGRRSKPQTTLGTAVPSEDALWALFS